MGITEIMEIMEKIVPIGTFLSVVIFNLDKILNMKNYLKEKNIMKIIAIADSNCIDENIKKIARERLKDMDFSYTLNFKINTAFKGKALDLIKNSKGNITIDDIRLAKNTIILSNGKLAINRWLYYSNWIIFYWVLISIVILFILYVEERFTSQMGLLYYAAITSMIISLPLLRLSYIRNKSTKKIKEALAEKQ